MRHGAAEKDGRMERIDDGTIEESVSFRCRLTTAFRLRAHEENG
jgi:hypothetical protein